MFSAADHSHMAHALHLAEGGLWTTTPNPRVGCVLVKDGVLQGAGGHERAGSPHAEALALAQAGRAARGATAYVTLEPCSHFGRTPPCAEALISAGVVRVVVAMQDPNPLVSGQGLAALRAAGVVVESGLMEREARELNIGFLSRMERGRPWLRLKVAASLDGRTALATGQSQWITSPEARTDGHRWRARACAVLTGIGTVRDDNPALTVRIEGVTRQPIKVLVDSRLEVSPDAQIFDAGAVWVACAGHFPLKAAALKARGAEVLVLPNANGKVDLPALIKLLAERGMNEVHVEAGCKLNGSLLAEGLVDELLLYLAPCLLGDTARGTFGMPGLENLAHKPTVKWHDLRQVGSDLRLMARF